MKALVFERSIPRYLAVNLMSRITGKPNPSVSPLQLEDIDVPQLPTPQWVRVNPLLSGICGSDLDSVTGHTSRYFESVGSFPFTMGHEIVGTLQDGSRVVVEPALGCDVRGISPRCPACEEGHLGTCHNVTAGDLEAGLQTGYCASTGGGWSEELVVHPSQLHAVPEQLSDEDAVMIEPTACAVHAATSRVDVSDKRVAVVGAGSLGLLVTAALADLTSVSQIIVGAKYSHQRTWAKELGADVVVDPRELARAVRSETSSRMYGKQLTGGVDVVFDCVGSAASIEQSLQIVKPRGSIVLVGMPGHVSVELSPLWLREISLAGVYCYGNNPNGKRDFEVAIEFVEKLRLGRLVSAKYPLNRFHDAIEHAANAGARGSVKVVFDVRASSLHAVRR